tara:strand:- start:104280 stop:105617 length:1338 start_codon:yes stop_codon:yes gene_type:complete
MSSTFNAYPNQAKPMRADIAKGKFQDAADRVKSKTDTNDKILYLMEYGRIEQLAGNFTQSRDIYTQAIANVDALQQKAKITATGMFDQSAALLVNDNAIPYQGYPYEYILLHQYQALNYVALGDVSGALVEVRRADEEQSYTQQLNQKTLAAADAKAKKESINNNVDFNQKQFQQMNAAAAAVKNQYLDAYSYYFGGLMFEATGSSNNAYVAYKQALSISPSNPYLQQNVLRLGKQLSMPDFTRYQKTYPQTIINPKPNQGKIAIIFEQGFIPLRKAFNLPLPINGSGIVPISMPYYADRHFPTPALLVSQGKETLGKTSAILNLQNLSARALKDEYPVLVVRAILRFAAKATMEHSAQKNAGDVGGIVANLYTVFSSGADLRTWSTLPNDVQIMQAYVNAGEQSLTLSYNGKRQTMPVKVTKGQTVLVWVVAYPTRLATNVFPL